MIVPVGLGIVSVVGLIHTAYHDGHSSKADFLLEALQHGVVCHIHLIRQGLP